jgi:hypothetical protein
MSKLDMKATRENPPKAAPFYGAFVLTFLAGSAFLGALPHLDPESYAGQQPSATVESATTSDLSGNPCDTMTATIQSTACSAPSIHALPAWRQEEPSSPKFSRG